MTYVVLARKWRPQRFEDLTGQEHVARTLQNAIASERIPHAVLFTGPRGVGKTSSARILSMALNCEQGPTPTPCGVCESCLEVQSGRSVDILEIDGASNRGINEIRELRDSVQYAPSRGRFKVYIIDEVHMLTTEAFNALLKTLEEPPPHVVFIFATTEPQKIPVTILSRCQRFDFRQIGLEDMLARLQEILSAEGIAAEPEALRMIARQADGGMRDALSLLDQVISSSDGTIRAEETADFLGTTDRRLLFAMSQAVIAQDAGVALRTLQQGLARGTNPSWLASEFASHLRDLTILAVAGDTSSLAILSDGEEDMAQKQLATTDAATLQALLGMMIQAAEEIAFSSMATLRFELALIQMCQMPRARRFDDALALLERYAGLPQEVPAIRPIATSDRPPEPPVSTETRTNEGTVDSTNEERSTADNTPTETAIKSEEAPSADPVSEPSENAEISPANTPTETHAAETSQTDRPIEPETKSVSDATAGESSRVAPFVARPKVDSSTATAPTAELWREIVSELRGPHALWGRILAMGYCLAEDGVFRVGISGAFMQDRDDLSEIFSELSTRKLGRTWTLRLVEDTSLSDEERARAWRIRNDEEQEEEAKRVEIFTRLQKHPFLQIIKKRWPDYQLQREDIDFQLLQPDEVAEDQGDV